MPHHFCQAVPLPAGQALGLTSAGSTGVKQQAESVRWHAVS